MSSIIYCSTSNINPKIKAFCLFRLREQAAIGRHQLIIIEQDESQPLHINSYYKNILKGLRKVKGNTVFIAEHDCLYPPGYFDQVPNQDISYCKNVYYLTSTGYLQRKFSYAPFSTLIANKHVLKECIKRKMAMEAIRWYEPAIEDPGFKGEIEWREQPYPVIDIRHDSNFTKNKQEFVGGVESLEPYGSAKDIWKAINDNTPATAPSPVAVSGNALEGRPDISIIITSRNEELLSWTIDNIRRTSKGHNLEIIVAFDGWQAERFVKQAAKADSYFFTSYDPMGVGRSRDLALCKARGTYAIIIDAHMDFSENWIDLLLEPVRKDDKAMSCSRSIVMSGECLDMNKEGLTVRHGARLPLSTENRKRIPLDPVWHTDRPAGEIQCILGACYGFTRQRYFEILRPWQYAVGWGSSEQVISVVNWWFGGSCQLTDAVSGHLYRTMSDAMERRSTNQTVPGLFYNRLRLFCLMPMDQSLREKFIQAVMGREDAIRHKDRIMTFLNMRPDGKLERAMKETGLTFEDYCKRWYPDLDMNNIFGETQEDKAQREEQAKIKSVQPVRMQPESKFVSQDADGRFL